jgi:hypothetical protein
MNRKDIRMTAIPAETIRFLVPAILLRVAVLSEFKTIRATTSPEQFSYRAD